MTPALARGLVAWFLLMLAVLPLVEWLGVRRPDLPASRAWAHLIGLPQAMGERLDTLHVSAPDAGPWTRMITANRAVLAALSAFEAGLEDDSPVGRLLRPPAQIVLSGWLGAGNERVYAGRDGWLFYRPDVEYVTGRGFIDPAQLARRVAGASELDTPPQPDARLAIRQFKRDLDARGLALVVMPTPVKPTVHPDFLAGGYGRRSGSPASATESAALGSSASSVAQNSSYSSFVDELTRDGVLVFDPLEAIARDESGQPQYLATDTHWRPGTVQRVVEALVVFLEAHVALPSVPAAGYRAEPREARQTGDTAAMLDLPPGQTLYPPERVSLQFIVGPDGDPWRSSHEADVLVLGDSFANMYSLATMGWGEAAGFVEQLSYAMQRPVDRIVQNDQGAHATRGLLRREVGGAADRLAGKRLVIWQFATRELAFGDWKVIELPPPSR